TVFYVFSLHDALPILSYIGEVLDCSIAIGSSQALNPLPEVVSIHGVQCNGNVTFGNTERVQVRLCSRSIRNGPRGSSSQYPSHEQAPAFCIETETTGPDDVLDSRQARHHPYFHRRD